MSSAVARYVCSQGPEQSTDICFSGDWTLDAPAPAFTTLASELEQQQNRTLRCQVDDNLEWDSALIAFLLQCHNYCLTRELTLDSSALPDGARKLLALSTAVASLEIAAAEPKSLLERLNPSAPLLRLWHSLEAALEFIGSVSLALGALMRGRANTRLTDFLNFLFEAGPKALGIITLTSFLVGMILAYLGAAQLAQFGAQVYVADLVTVGMLREMGALMTAVVMAGRTGAAYAAQLGTMQTREEIDAIVTLGISPVEFLVLPRLLALIVIMPLLVIYANFIGILGGALVASGMGVSLTQFLEETRTVITLTQLNVGLGKALVFGTLIALAGCYSGINCGRSSAAVGEATTNAVVTAIVFLIVADAAINIALQNMGI
ncbi:ABC transporter permease [Halieaceae bacterium IMCC14734]|uniref:ABC transporter permease n=1 Tax=Candidatus Litorirhabdus singularis TaxID=2518993 RepID=A0ABT3TIK4_9GAMM|nr:ABC transporter permease [Candidatus Litorirhabdus singularis]MCX2982167.1 ABC transporter permease [Candidatus Litorirhabdus singularis]